MANGEMGKPLSGIRVVELPGLAPVPFCGRILADFGAIVLAIEKEHDAIISAGNALARGKRTMSVNFRSAKDICRLRAVCERADVLLDPFRPGVLAQLGLDPVQLLEKNPKLIIAMISGYGQTGPYHKLAGHDINFLSLSGLMPISCGKSLRPPANLLGDFAGGALTAAFAICSALFQRERIGRGCVIDCSMTEGIAYLGTFIAQEADDPFLFAHEYAALADKCPIYRTYETSDQKFMAVGGLEPKFHRKMFSVLGLDADDAVAEMYATPGEFAAKLAQIFMHKSQAEWTKIFYEADACVTPVLELPDVGDFAQHRQRNFFRRCDGADGGDATRGKWIPGAAPRILSVEEYRRIQQEQQQRQRPEGRARKESDFDGEDWAKQQSKL